MPHLLGARASVAAFAVSLLFVLFVQLLLLLFVLLCCCFAVVLMFPVWLLLVFPVMCAFLRQLNPTLVDLPKCQEQLALMRPR